MKVPIAALVERCLTEVLKPSQIGIRIHCRPQNRCDRAEDGYVLVAVIFMMALLVLSLSVAVPRIKQDIQRDREQETVQRGKQYIRAIQLYYRKFHRYPPSVDALENTDGIRFLRKKYLDPITRKDDWQAINFGQNKVPKMGLFGQPLEAPRIGTGPGTNETPTSMNGPSASSIGSRAGADTSTQNPTNSQTFGGTGIIGFSVPSDQKSILRYKLQDHYSLWEFVYDWTQESGRTVSRQGPGSNTGATTGTDSTGSNPSAPGTPPGSPPNNPPCGGKVSPNGTQPSPCLP